MCGQRRFPGEERVRDVVAEHGDVGTGDVLLVVKVSAFVKVLRRENNGIRSGADDTEIVGVVAAHFSRNDVTIGSGRHHQRQGHIFHSGRVTLDHVCVGGVDGAAFALFGRTALIVAGIVVLEWRYCRDRANRGTS